MPQYYLQFGLILAALIGLAVGTWATPRLIRSFEFRRRFNLWLAAWFFGCVVLLLYSGGTIRRTNGAVIFALLATGCMLTGALRQKSRKECRQNYLHDPAHCGRCGHDLAASEGRCLQCGWLIPRPDAPIERLDWGMPWRSGWRIDYLENWRKTLAFTAIGVPAFAAMTAWSVYLPSPLAAVLAGFLTLFFSMNVLRVVEYAQARRRQAVK